MKATRGFTWACIWVGSLLLAFCASCFVENRHIPNSSLDARRWEWEAMQSSHQYTGPGLQVAFVEGSLVPPGPVSLAGFGGIGRRLLFPRLDGNSHTFCRPAQEIVDPPKIRLALFAGQTESLQLWSLDTVAVTPDVSRTLYDTLAQSDPVGVHNPGQLVTTATHTHSGPAGFSVHPLWSDFACDRSSQSSVTFLKEQALSLYKEAKSKLAPLKSIEHASGPMAGNHTRFPGMSVSRTLHKWSFTHASGKSLGCIVLWPMHATWWGSHALTLTADGAGSVANGFSKKEASTCLFLNDTGGNATLDVDSLEELETYVADWKPEAVSTRAAADTDIRFSTVTVDVPHPEPNLKACHLDAVNFTFNAGELLPKRTRISTVEWPGARFLFWPGEPLADIREDPGQLEIQNTTTHYVGLADDYLGYFVGPAFYKTQALESCSSLFGPGMGGRLKAEFEKLMAPK